MEFKDKIAVVTGGAQGIGRCIADEFRHAGARVCVIDRQIGDHFVGDIADKQVLEQFAKEVIGKYGHVDFLINNAPPLYTNGAWRHSVTARPRVRTSGSAGTSTA